jgi:threonine dehydrogenase-like Zn-dependent dehydrogenase
VWVQNLRCRQRLPPVGYANGIARPGGKIGYLGIPHGSETINLGRMFLSNITLGGGVTPARAYIPELLNDVLAGIIDPSPVPDAIVDLDVIKP